MNSAHRPSENIADTKRASFTSRDGILLSLLELHDNSGIATPPTESDEQTSLPVDGHALDLISRDGISLSPHDNSGLAIPPTESDEQTSFPLDGHDLDLAPEQLLISAFREGPVIYDQGCIKVVRISQNAVIKAGVSVFESEAEAMRLISTHLPSIRLPYVFRSFMGVHVVQGFKMEMGYIVMEYVAGTCLGNGVWRELSPTAKAAVYDQLISYIQQMRAFSLPRDARPGRLGGGLSVGILFSDSGSGPFISLGELVRYFNLKMALTRHCRGVQDSGFTEEEFSPLVFIHGDIAEKNLILDTTGTLWLMDWATAGVYPAFFEWAAMQRQEWTKGFVDGLKARLAEKGFFDYDVDEEKVKRFKTLSWCLDFPVFDEGFES
jgi:hypothetical protein